MCHSSNKLFNVCTLHTHNPLIYCIMCETLRINRRQCVVYIWFIQEASLLHSRSHRNSAHTVEEMLIISTSTTFYDWKYKHYFVIVEV